MKKQSRFMAGALVLVGVVGYLAVTGMKDSMMYYYTPDELAAKVTADPTAHALGAKVGGRVVPGTVQFDPRTLDLRFNVVDIASGKTSFPVHYNGPLPDTFEEGRDVVVEGKLTEAGTFEATTVLTKCGSRYEAAEEDFKA
ncbi:cytochrome c maturation protein CcmE [Longimicrobium sp.]|uniref:cytochrome c maturation protein CcmE n=1 Tax=Longimicrobium sp. TaxID=2029185 RepID=UPI003B3AE069